MQLQLLEYSSLEMAVVMHILRLDTPIVPSGIVLEIISLSLSLSGGFLYIFVIPTICCFVFPFVLQTNLGACLTSVGAVQLWTL